MRDCSNEIKSKQTHLTTVFEKSELGKVCVVNVR